MRSIVSTDDLRVGMFVADLDRPWLGTPFLLQGFLVESQEDIDALRRYCRFVHVDRSRSVGDQYEAPAVWHPEARSPGTDHRPAKTDEPQRDFHEVLRSLQYAGATKGPRRPVPRIHDSDQQSAIEEEMVYAAPFYEELRNALRNVAEAIETAGTPDFGPIKENLAEVVRSIQRNPDAAIWLTRLRRTDQYAYDHSLDVSVHMVVFGRFLGMPEAILEKLGLAALMLDIGKTRIAPETLSKPGPLDDDEFATVKNHVADSLDIVVGKGSFDPHVLLIIAQHHERHDGSGYPNGLSGKDIGLYAEMAGIVDTFCAMIRQRPYRAAITTQRGLEHLVRVRGSQFRDLVVDQFIQCIGLYPVGSLVELSSGEVAVVVSQNQVRRLKPRVMILLAPDKSAERRPRTIDLIYDPAGPTGDPYRIVRALPPDAYGIDPREFFLA